MQWVAIFVHPIFDWKRYKNDIVSSTKPEICYCWRIQSNAFPKISRRGHVYNGVASPVSSRNSSSPWERRGWIAFLFLLHIWVHLLNCLEPPLCYSLFNNTVSILCAMYGQAGQFSNCTLLLWSHAFVIVAECDLALFCWNKQDVPEKRSCTGSISFSKTCIYQLALIAFTEVQTLAFELCADNKQKEHGAHCCFWIFVCFVLFFLWMVVC